MTKKTDFIYIIASFIFYASIIGKYLVAYQKQCSAFCIFLSFLYIVFVLKKKNKYQKYRISAGIIALLVSVIYFLKRNFILQVLFSCFCFLVGITERIIKAKQTKEVWKRPFLDEKLKYIAAVLLSVLGTVAFSFLTYYDFSPVAFIEQFAEKEENTFSYEPSQDLVYDENISVRTNLVYDDVYPNSIFDLIYDPEYFDEGLLVWIHGGNYLSDHKDDENQSREFILNSIQEGFSVVSMDYAYMTDYRFPAGIVQLDSLFQYLLDHQDELRLNMDNISICGTGSGADIALNYIVAHTNKEYADLIGVHPCVQNVQGSVLVSALYEPSLAMDTGLILTDYIGYQLYRTYYNTLDLSSVPYRVFDYVNSSFPPCLIADGNTGTYVRQGHMMDELLEKKNIYHISLLNDDALSQKELVQKSFDLQSSHFTSALHGRLIELLRRIKEE